VNELTHLPLLEKNNSQQSTVFQFTEN